MNRPARNGSSNSTVEILIALVVIGASALTALALSSKREEPSKKDHEPPDEE